MWSTEQQHVQNESQECWSAAMVTLEICGLPVEFPFKPYNSQLIYMEKVMLALTSKQNAIIESPTGTGKVLYPFFTIDSHTHNGQYTKTKLNATSCCVRYKNHVDVVSALRNARMASAHAEEVIWS